MRDKNNEVYFYNFFNTEDLLKTPQIYQIGQDFIEIEMLKREAPSDLARTIEEVCKLYIRTQNIKLSIPNLDLSKEKIAYRLNYLKEEVKKREVNPSILKESKCFLKTKYAHSNQICIVHGDLKSPHIFPTKQGIKFIDFALSGIATPWYDLSFLYMEEQENKKGVFDIIVDSSLFKLKKEFGLNQKRIKDSLQSAIFYRTLYLFGFALRHRPKKSLDRIIKELEDIIELR